MWARVAFAFVVVLGVACAGKSTSSDESTAGGSAGENGGSSGASSGGGVSGGSAGTAAGANGGTGGAGATGGAGGDTNCNDERRSMRTFINENKSCAETADCTVLHGTCGITEDGCTNAVYVNNATDPMSYDFQRLRLRSCLSDFEGTESCVSCDRVPAPPTCVDGKCIGTSACALEANAIWDFKSRNDACTVDDDCTTAFVGCDVTEDGCTGAVYFAADFDRDELTKLQAELSGCSGGCSVCEREAAPPACVSGRCVIRPLR